MRKRRQYLSLINEMKLTLYRKVFEEMMAMTNLQLSWSPTSMFDSRYPVCLVVVLAIACAHGRRDAIATIHRLQIVVHEISEKYTAFRFRFIADSC